jgi:small subunit ribosomal protein S18
MAENTPNTNASAPAPAAPSRDSGPREGPSSGGPRRERSEQGGRRGRYSGPRPPKTCPFCSAKVKYIDYKQGDQLRRYLTERGKIKARRKIGTCAKHQRRLALAIKRARHIALLPFTASQARGD